MSVRNHQASAGSSGSHCAFTVCARDPAKIRPASHAPPCRVAMDGSSSYGVVHLHVAGARIGRQLQHCSKEPGLVAAARFIRTAHVLNGCTTHLHAAYKYVATRHTHTTTHTQNHKHIEYAVQHAGTLVAQQ